MLLIMETHKLDRLKNGARCFFRQNTLVCILFINFVLAIICFWINDIQFGNDDTIMCWIASGSFLGQPDPHLVFSNFIYGLVLSLFYKTFPLIEWYSIFLITIQVLSISIIQKEFLQLKCSRFVRILIVVAVGIMELKLFRSLTFTTTAGIVATASFMVICKRSAKHYLIGALLFVIATFVRFFSAMLVSVIFLSFYPIYVHRCGFSKKEFFALSLCAFLGVAFQFVDRQYYKLGNDWNYYYETNKARAGINDHVDVWRIKSDMPDGVIESDIDLLYLYGIRDSEIFNNESLSELHDIMNRQTGYKSIPYIRKIKHIPYHIKDYAFYWLAVLPLVLILLAYVKGNRKELLLGLLPVVVLPLITSIVSMELIVKERAFLCAYIPFLLYFMRYVCIVCIGKNAHVRKLEIWLGCAVLLSVSPLVKFGVPGKTVKNKDCANIANYIQENQLLPLCVDWPFDGNVMSVSNSYYDFSSNGWTYNMPGRIQIDKFVDLIYEEKLVIVGNVDSSDFFKLMDETVCFHYGVHVRPSVLKKCGNFVIYRLVERNENTVQ